MKYLKRVLLVFVCVFTLIGLASCSTVGKVKKAFTKEGYTWTEYKIEKEKKAELKENGIDGVFIVSKDGTVLKNIPYAIVIEFSGDKAEDAYKAIKDENIFTDEALNKIVSAVSSTPVTNGNCMILTIDNNVRTIFVGA